MSHYALKPRQHRATVSWSVDTCDSVPDSYQELREGLHSFIQRALEHPKAKTDSDQQFLRLVGQLLRFKDV